MFVHVPISGLCKGLAKAVFIATSAAATSAFADGTYAQLDVSKSTMSGVFSTTIGSLSYGATAVDFDGGHRQGLNLLYELPRSVGKVTIKIGPSFGRVNLETKPGAQTKFGVKLVLDRYTATGFGNVYLLAEANTVDSAVFLLGQIGLSSPGVNFELSYGVSESYTETTIAVAKHLGSSAVSLRAGYRFNADELFLGMSINTF